MEHKIVTPRVCIREEFVEGEGQYLGWRCYECTIKEWTFYYSDGTEEVVTRLERIK